MQSHGSPKHRRTSHPPPMEVVLSPIHHDRPGGPCFLHSNGIAFSRAEPGAAARNATGNGWGRALGLEDLEGRQRPETQLHLADDEGLFDRPPVAAVTR